MRFIICCFSSISIVFIVNKVLMCFVMRSSSLILTSLFRFNANNHNIKMTWIFNCINAKVDDCDVGI